MNQTLTRGLPVLLLALLLAGGFWWWQRAPVDPLAVQQPAAAPTAAPPAALPPSAFVDNRLCLDCHTEQAKAWQGSHHAHAMAPATAENVRGDFNNATFKHQGVTSTFSRRGDKFIVRTDGPDGRPGDFEIAYTFGVEPLQQYLIALPGGRLQPLQIAWDSPRKRWFHLLPKEHAPPGDVLHWTGRYQTANTMCIACHTTGFEKRYDAAADSFDSRWKESNVSCQSCHGPGERHAQWARLKAEGKAAPETLGETFGLDLRLKTAGARQQVDTCAACHARRGELVPNALPGRPRLDQQLPALLTERLYHADGQQLDEVFVDGSFRQSRMYQKGVACTNCHDPHSGKLRMQGNAVCTQCHTPQGNPAFPSAAGAFDTPAHHFHKADSAGAQCVACHMPSKTYMQIQPRPDHSLRVPRPDLTLKIGTPNACNGCHAAKSAQWAADQVAAWYGTRRREQPHYGETFAAARAGQPQSHEALVALAGDADQPAIVRATALNALRADGSTGLGARLDATRDADPEVRAAAADSFESAPAAQRVYALVPLLSDPVRAVRIAAAHSLSSLPPDQIEAAHRPAFDAALAEYIAAQGVALDMPGAQLNLAVVYQNTGRADLAEQHYLQALKIDPDFTPARLNLSALYNQLGRNADALKVLATGVQREPGVGEMQYSLGLLLAEEQRMDEAAAALGKAAKLLPGRARVQYNHGLIQQQLGHRKPAEQALLAAQWLAPQDPAMAYALAVFYAQGGQMALAPDDPQARQFAQSLKSREPAAQPSR